MTNQRLMDREDGAGLILGHGDQGDIGTLGNLGNARVSHRTTSPVRKQAVEHAAVLPPQDIPHHQPGHPSAPP